MTSSPRGSFATRSGCSEPSPRSGPGTYDRQKSPEERRDEQRRRLILAAARVFSRDGFAGASVASILEVSGLSRGTFYRHFEDLPDVFIAVRRAAAELAYEVVSTSVRRESEPVGRLARRYPGVPRADRAARGSGASSAQGPSSTRRRARAFHESARELRRADARRSRRGFRQEPHQAGCRTRSRFTPWCARFRAWVSATSSVTRKRRRLRQRRRCSTSA